MPAVAYMRPPNYNNCPQFSGTFFSRRHYRAQFSSDFFSLVVALNNNLHTSARAQKIFTMPNMRLLSIREPPPPDPGVQGGPSAGSGKDQSDTTIQLLSSTKRSTLSP